MHPIVTPDGKPACQTPGLAAYWVAKDDFPKFNEGFATLLGYTQSDANSNVLQAPKVPAFNGQFANIQDVTQRAFITDVISTPSEPGYQPIITVLSEGQTIQTFSLLSWDCRTATTDVFSELSKIVKVNQTAFAGVNLQRPRLEKIDLSAQNLVWPVDGMLVVILGGIERQVEGQYEKGIIPPGQIGTPVLSKLPYLNRLVKTTAIHRDTTSLLGIMTVKMGEETQQQARRGNDIVR